jgi:hypothetical protein
MSGHAFAMRVAAVSVVMGGLVWAGAPAAAASTSGAYLSPSSTTGHASLRGNRSFSDVAFYFGGDSPDSNFTIYCSTFNFLFKTPPDGLWVTFSHFVFGGCANPNTGSQATVSASGVWKDAGSTPPGPN